MQMTNSGTGNRGEFEQRPLWAPWRMQYIRDDNQDEGCFFCRKADDGEDEKNLVVARGEKSFLLLNAFPYNSGHTLVAPYRHVADLSDLETDELNEMTSLLVRLKAVMANNMHPDGFNLGYNLGEAAGAGVAGHVHGHLVPRWCGDTNFMPVLADIRVVPQALEETVAFLREAWQREEAEATC